jgi:glycopeptide antibiotics resistance protein
VRGGGGWVWFRPVPFALGVCVVLVALVVLARIDPARARPWVRVLIAVSVLGILGVTILGGSTASASSNLVPGRTIVEELTGGRPLGVFNVVGNVAMFVPLGWLLVLATARRPLTVAVVAGVGLSVTIELVQSLIGRVSDIDDVILNGTGALVGGCVALLLRGPRSGRPART